MQEIPEMEVIQNDSVLSSRYLGQLLQDPDLGGQGNNGTSDVELLAVGEGIGDVSGITSRQGAHDYDQLRKKGKVNSFHFKAF